MKICPKCEKEHDRKGTFCSRSCANSRFWNREDNKKKSKSARGYWKSLSPNDLAKRLEGLKEQGLVKRKKRIEYLFLEDWNDLAYRSKRLRVIIEQDAKCNKCGIDNWLGNPIILEYEHKDGNNTNNLRENVEALCPNCHSQTPTWRGKKAGSTYKSVLKDVDLYRSTV